MGGGTEAFPDLGQHCQHPDCHQLDFLPFKCDGCRKVFCLEHRSYKTHECPKSDHNSRKVVVCEVCSISIEITGRDGEEAKEILERHERSGNCDPKKKRKPTCAVRRCKEILTFSNTSRCKNCQQKVCLKHRFPADHACQQPQVGNGSWNDKFLADFASRTGVDCAKTGRRPAAPTTTSSSIKAC